MEMSALVKQVYKFISHLTYDSLVSWKLEAQRLSCKDNNSTYSTCINLSQSLSHYFLKVLPFPIFCISHGPSLIYYILHFHYWIKLLVNRFYKRFRIIAQPISSIESCWCVTSSFEITANDKILYSCVWYVFFRHW